MKTPGLEIDQAVNEALKRYPFIDGTKMWITNGSIADLAIVWAQTDEGIRGFVVPRGARGFSATNIERKLSLRASVTSELVLAGCRLPGDALLPLGAGLVAPLSCLNEARFGIVWGAIGAARSCYESALEYSKTRIAFDRPIGGFQMTQAKLVDMLLELNKGALLALHLGRAKDGGRLHPSQVSLAKLNNVREALAIARSQGFDVAIVDVRGHERIARTRRGQRDHRPGRLYIGSALPSHQQGAVGASN